MSYLFIVVIGAVAGWAAGQYVKGSEAGVGIDFIAGAIGACVFVVLSRMISDGASGVVMSILIAVIGAVVALYGMRRYMKSKQPVPVVRRPKARR